MGTTHLHIDTRLGSSRERISSVDLLRGCVMVLMAIDHVRVYSGIPAGRSTAPYFFTRWVTHFCVPTFVFFAGVSAFLYGQKNSQKLPAYLLTRGLLLVVLELTVLRFFWTFNFHYSDFILAGVIWMLGWCMILLSFCVRFPPTINAAAGVILILFQQVFKSVPSLLPASWQPSFDWFWAFLYPTGHEGHAGISILYVLIPWIGVMMIGFAFGPLLLLESAKRKKLCLWIGSLATATFAITATAGYLWKPIQNGRPILYNLLDQQKYPPSALYLLMTLGPVIFCIPFAEKAKGKIAEVFLLLGRVPLFYYLAHIPLIHLLALGVNLIRTGHAHQPWYDYAPFTEIDPANRWPLPLLYLVFLIAEILLYFLCRAYARYKQNRPQLKILKYL